MWSHTYSVEESKYDTGNVHFSSIHIGIEWNDIHMSGLWWTVELSHKCYVALHASANDIRPGVVWGPQVAADAVCFLNLACMSSFLYRLSTGWCKLPLLPWQRPFGTCCRDSPCQCLPMGDSSGWLGRKSSLCTRREGEETERSQCILLLHSDVVSSPWCLLCCCGGVKGWKSSGWLSFIIIHFNL